MTQAQHRRLSDYWLARNLHSKPPRTPAVLTADRDETLLTLRGLGAEHEVFCADVYGGFTVDGTIETVKVDVNVETLVAESQLFVPVNPRDKRVLDAMYVAAFNAAAVWAHVDQESLCGGECGAALSTAQWGLCKEGVTGEADVHTAAVTEANDIVSNAVYFTSEQVEHEEAVLAYDAVFDMSDMVALTAATSTTVAPVGVAGFEREVKVKSLSDEEYKLRMKAVEKEWRSLLDNEVFEPVTLKEMRKRCEGQGKDVAIKASRLDWWHRARRVKTCE